ncbi:DUF523 domain-containing protein [Caloramator sp. E03]|uniref:DUF523 domain-containing protein n=1 Tax=Caloramator sp. E03 TaxID=2576307 RepID=UPI00111064B7|nr:DUF523 domain-containing protein [Caloramator sp. E03]QCX33701.1 DUF523 domain-containing protein [Caloramator sp. E03]
MILVSSCLLGLDTRYNGKNNSNDLLIEYSCYGKFIPICPEQLGGLSTPREPSEIIGGTGKDVMMGYCKILNCKGEDVTEQYVKGAKEVIKIIKMFPVKAAILKQKSPSCGSKRIYDGCFKGKIRDGEGVAAYILRENNIPIYSEEDINRELLEELIFNKI